MSSTMKLLREALEEGVITCPDCGNEIEPDAEECCCGWRNPLLTQGLI
ncbi:MAG TPA: hypothetical protein VKM55_22100 [Candidatus Lokiarchaeia archaeon]|nr:hypothetical protein [Candidatus Lokiarchaeia archaeon]